MDRQERFETLATLSEQVAVELARRVMDGALGNVDVVSPPTVGMIMARAVDGAQGEVFNLGEVLVTEARVSLAGQEGWGMVLGRSPDHALAVAVVDAGLEAGHPAAVAIERELERQAVSASAVAAERWQRLAPTRVSFDLF